MTKRQENPYKVLYWMGGALVLLFLGVAALVMFMPKSASVPKEPERTMLWIYNDADPKGAASVVIIEESREHGTLVAVPFPASEEARAAYDGGRPRRAQDLIAGQLDRQLHNRVFLTTAVISTLVDAAGGIRVEGEQMNGAAALAYMEAGGEQAAYRATQVMMSMADAVSTRGVNLGVSEALGLARQVDTNMDLFAIPDVIGRWSQYGTPRIWAPPDFDPATLSALLAPDPGEGE